MSQIMRLEGQAIVYDPALNVVWLYLRNGAFIKGGQFFGTFKGPALSANAEILGFAASKGATINVIVAPYHDRYYAHPARTWLDESRQLRSIMQRNGIVLHACPWSRFRTIRDAETVAKVVGYLGEA